MALVTLNQDLYLPMTVGSVTSGPGVTDVALDAANKKAAVVFQPAVSGNIHKIVLYFRTVTTPGNVDVRVETVDATTGLPTGTLVSTNSNVTLAVSASSSFYTATLTADAVVTANGTNRYAIVVAYSSGTYNIGFNANVVIGFSAQFYGVVSDGSSVWTKNANTLICGIEYDTTAYYRLFGVAPTNIATTTFNTGSTPDERGNVYVPEFNYHIIGFWIQLDADQNCTLSLYDSGSTALLTGTLDKDNRINTNHYLHIFRADTSLNSGAYTLTASATYRVAVISADTTSIITAELVVPTQAALATLGGGTTCYQTTRTDAGAWTDTTTRRVMIGLVADGIDITGGVSLNRAVGSV